MSVLIEGMEMPKAEFGSMIVAIRPDGMVEDVMGCYVGKAVPVPPHGRLIDSDKLKSYWEPDHSRYFDADYFIHTIDVAPIVIPASEEVET